MIFGIGCDILEIDRITPNERFEKRFFTKAEQEFFSKRKNKKQAIASNFAVKEAFSKALGTGVRDFGLPDVEVLRDELGKPYINLLNGAKDIAIKMGIKNIFVSISHTDSLVSAFVVLEK